ncbi:MAG: class I SAM-dependent methyltransferase [Chitinophagaceae bacterium]|nr:class I SAM-dependent methyltransferase [Chitinophagaceae bacterium]
MSNINDSYFDGYYKEIWKAIIPEELTPKETDFMLQYFNLKPGDNVLDIMCGYGRHSIKLAEKGLNVTAVDNLAEYITEIQEVAESRKLPLTAIQANILDFPLKDKYDLVICMGNSLNFFDPKDTLSLLARIAGSLKQGGHLLVNTWSLTEIAAKSFIAKTWSDVGDIKFISESKYLFFPTRIETDSIMLSLDGSMEKKKAIDYIFSIAEMDTMLSEAGLILKEVYSIPGRKKFALGEPRAYLVAEKV